MTITRGDTRFTEEQMHVYGDSPYGGGVQLLAAAIERNARERPFDEAFIDERTRLSWKELQEEACVVAGGLRDLGLQPGDVLAVQIPNRVEALVLFLAAWAVGIVVCPFPMTLRSREVEFILTFAGAKAVAIVDSFEGFSHIDMVEEIRPGLPALEHVIVIGEGRRAGCRSYGSVAERKEPLDQIVARVEQHHPDSGDVCRLLFTSGSTGDPKGVLHTYDTTVPSNVLQNEHMGITGDSVMLLFIPAMLNWGMFQLLQTILAGAKLVMMEKFEPGRALRLIESERVTCVGCPPTALVALLRDPTLAATRIDSLALVATAGASCPVELLRETAERLGCDVMDGYGMTEVGWISATAMGDPIEEKVGSVGTPFPWMQVRVLDENHHDLVPGTTGEVAVGGPFVCGGYYHNDIRNRESWTSDGWFLTGDLGYIDPNGRLRLVGRSKEVIKHGGSQVWPRELEELLFTHPKIRDVAVVGVPDDYFGENICACVIPVAGATMSLEEITDFLKPRVAKYKLPQRLVICDQFPYTSTGKLQRHVLRQWAIDPSADTLASQRSGDQ